MNNFNKDDAFEIIYSIKGNNRKIWQRLTDLYAECTIDYDKESETTKDLYKFVFARFFVPISGNHKKDVDGILDEEWIQWLEENAMVYFGYIENLVNRGTILSMTKLSESIKAFVDSGEIQY